jgi:pyridoxamine 5'-phosphate oxidase family protein
MRMIGFVCVLAVVIALGYVLYQAISSATGGAGRWQGALEAGAKWRVRHYGQREGRVVAVSLVSGNGRVLDEHVVDRIADNDPAWEEHFLRAMQTAEERAFHLNSTRPDEE